MNRAPMTTEEIWGSCRLPLWHQPAAPPLLSRSQCRSATPTTPTPCTNQPPNPDCCRYYFPAGGGVLGLCVVLFLQLVINWVLCCCIRKRGKSNAARLQAVPQGAQTAHNDLLTVRCMRNLTGPEVQKLTQQWKKFDKNGDGMMCGKEMKVFFNGTLRIKLSDMDVAMTLQRFDTNKSGSLCFQEFMAMCKSSNTTAWG